MKTPSLFLWFSYIITLLVLVVGFGVFYYETGNPTGSFFAAFCSALLVLGTIIVLSWIIKSLEKK